MKFSRRIAVAIATVSVLIAASLALGGGSAMGAPAWKASPTPTPTTSPAPGGGTLRVTCISWYQNGGGTQWHSNSHVKDANGNSVTGAVVTVDQYKNGVKIKTVTGTTATGTGGGNGAGCAPGTPGTAVTPDACLSNAGAGTYTTKIVSVTKAGYTWDGVTPANSFVKA